MAREFLEILDLADFVHFIDDSIQDRLDLFVGFLLEERPLAFEPALVPQELFLVEIRDLFLSSLRSFHLGRNITPHRVSLQASF